MYRKILNPLLGILAVLLLCGCSRDMAASRTGFYFDTVIEITAYGEKSEEAVDQCFKLCGEMERIFSPTRSDSELYQVNHRSSDRVTVSDDLACVIEAGLSFYRLSDGKFDITIAPVSSLWDFKSEDPLLPDEEKLKEAVRKVDASLVHLSGNTLTFDSADTMLDLGGLAKGYAADQLKECLESYGIESAIINLGGNVVVVGREPDEGLWKVGIQKPFGQRNELITTVETQDRSVVSSGVYERCFEKDGRLYSHILDASTGYPADTDLWQATILSDSSLTGDGLSTVCILLGYEKARALTDTLDDIEAIFVLNGGRLAEDMDSNEET